MSLTSAEISSMRAAVNVALPDIAAIQRLTVTSDGGGGQTQIWTTVLTAPSRVAPVGGGEDASRGDRAVEEATHVATLPATTDVRETDRVVIGGQTYEVTLVKERGSWEMSRRVELKEIP